MAEPGFHKVRALSRLKEHLRFGPMLHSLAVSLPPASPDSLHNDKRLPLRQINQPKLAEQAETSSQATSASLLCDLQDKSPRGSHWLMRPSFSTITVGRTINQQPKRILGSSFLSCANYVQGQAQRRSPSLQAGAHSLAVTLAKTHNLHPDKAGPRASPSRGRRPPPAR